ARNISAGPLVAVRGCSATDVAASAAVVWIGIQQGAGPVAVDGARDAVVAAKSRNAGDGLVGTRRGTLLAAASPVVDVIVEIGTMTATKGPTGGAGHVGSARTAGAAGVAPARPADFETLRLLRLFAALTEGIAHVLPCRPRGFQPQRAEHRAGEN